MLIKMGAPQAESDGMDPGSPLAPGRPPPWISPHCRRCRLPCERFTIDPVSSSFYLAIQWVCCGRTGGTKVPVSEVLYKSKHGGAVWVNEPKVKANAR